MPRAAEVPASATLVGWRNQGLHQLRPGEPPPGQLAPAL